MSTTPLPEHLQIDESALGGTGFFELLYMQSTFLDCAHLRLDSDPHMTSSISNKIDINDREEPNKCTNGTRISIKFKCSFKHF
jgi:hypothetical protein